MRTNFKPFLICALIFLHFHFKAQLSGTITVPSITYPTFLSALSALNVQGISGPLTIQVSPGFSEIAPAGGYSLFPVPGATSTNSVLITKSSAGLNPVLSAPPGTAVPSSAMQDGIFRFIGADYIQINGIDLYDPNSTNPATMEFGYGLFKLNGNDGCQFISITNCTITLRKANNAAGLGPATHGSRGIDMVNALPGSHTLAVTVSSSAGTHSYNKFYNNLIQDCNTGIAAIGYNDGPPYLFADQQNEIGSTLTNTGNTIFNFGGGTSGNQAFGILTDSQFNVLIANNTLLSNNGAGNNHAGTLSGITSTVTNAGTTSILNNTITVKCGGTTQANTAIEALGLSGLVNATLNINANVIANCTYSTASSGSFCGIYNSVNAAEMSINSNTLSNNSVHCATGGFKSIYNRAAIATFANINNNVIDMGSLLNPTPSFFVNGIYYGNSSVQTTTLSCNNNVFQNFIIPSTNSSAQSNCIMLDATVVRASINGNNFNTLVFNHSNLAALIGNNSSTGLLELMNNYTTGTVSKTRAAQPLYGYFNTGNAAGSTTMTGNNFSNMSASGSCNIIPFYTGAGINNVQYVNSNTLTNISAGSGDITGIVLGLTGNGSTMNDNVLSGWTGGGSMTGLYYNGNNGQVARNVIASFSTTGTGTIMGLYHNNGSNNEVHKNRIYDLSAAGSSVEVNGLLMLAGGNVMIHNNLIGDLRAPAANGANVVSGLNIKSGTALVYYNTVRLAAASSGTLFGSSALTIDAAAVLNLRNNILCNVSLSIGTGSTVAYRRTAGSLSTFSLTSNNNIYYAGTPSPVHLIYSDIVNNFQTIGSYKTYVGPRRDSVSATENTPFISLNGANPAFLHISPTAGTFAESGGRNVVGITTDVDLQTRQGNPGYVGTGTAPDIGADEISQPPCSTVSPAVLTPTSLCHQQSVVIGTPTFMIAQGLTYSWESSTSPAGPFFPLSAGTWSLGGNFSTGTLSAGTYYYRLITTCGITTNSIASNVATVSVGAYPTVTAAVAPTLVCTGHTASLSALSGNAIGFTWAGPAGYTASTQSAQVLAGNNSAGQYTVTATSSLGCSGSTVITVNLLPLPVLAAVSIPSVICAGQTATLYAGGASQFTWSTQQTGTAIVVAPATSQTYTISNQSSPCPLVTTTLNVNVVPTPTLSVTTSPASLCIGASGTFVVSGAATYSWNTGFTGSTYVQSTLSSAPYIVTGTSNNCSASSTLVASPLPLVTLSTSGASVCAGSSTTLTAVGASTYSWSMTGNSGAIQIVQPVVSNTYVVTGFLSGCSKSQSISVVALSLPQLTISPPSKTICAGEKVSLLGDGAISYSWQPGNNGSFLFVDTPTVTTTYSLAGTGSNGCSSSTTATVYVDICEAIKAETGMELLSVFPNPAEGLFHVHSGAPGPMLLTVTDLQGQVLQRYENANGRVDIDLSNYANGLYLLAIEQNGERRMMRLVKTNAR